jgi:hypothetical protein
MLKYLFGLCFLYLIHLIYQDYRMKNFQIDNGTIVFNECQSPDKCEFKTYTGTIKMNPKNRELYVVMPNGDIHTGRFVSMSHPVKIPGL